MQTGLFPPKANICNVYNNNIWINALILHKRNVKEDNTMRKLCKTLKIKQQCISVSHICCWWIAQVAYCLCIGCQWWIPWQNWVIENGTNVTNSSYAWKETWSIIFNNLNTDRCQPPTKIRWTYKFQKLYLCYVGWNQWLWVQVLRMYTGCMVLQPRTIDMILGFSPCFLSARTCYPWNTGPEPVLSTHTLTL